MPNSALARPRRRFLTTALVAVLSLGAFGAAVVEARPTSPSPQNRQIARFVRLLMESRHLTKHPIDDEISRRGLETFLKTLDPWKLYFYQSDVDEFARDETRLDDLFRQGDITFAYKVFTRFLARIEERSAMAIELVDTPHDFTVDEEMIRDIIWRIMAAARDAQEGRTRWGPPSVETADE